MTDAVYRQNVCSQGVDFRPPAPDRRSLYGVTSARALLVLTGVLALLVAGCSGGEEGIDAVDPETLSIMVVPPEGIAEHAESLEIDGELSGPSTAADAAEASVDPADTPARIEATGRKAGYDLHFVDPDLSTLDNKAGVVEVASGVELFATPAQAAAYREQVIGAYSRFVGKEISPGVRLVRAEAEEADVGGGARLVRSTLRGDGFVVNSTAIDFGLDEVVATVVVSRADEVDTSPAALELAKELERRIRSAAAGDLDDSAVQFDGGRVPGAATPPPGGEKLSGLVLAVGDLPRGTFVDDEAYATGDDGVSFDRRFVLGLRRVGGSQLASLESAVERMAGPRQALAAVVGLALALDGPQGEEYFAAGYAQGARFRPEDVDVDVFAVRGLGNAFVARVRFTSPLGRVETALGVVAVGRHVGRISAVAPAGRLDQDDVVALLATQALRMARS
jgi:hypothetical protein